MLLRFYVVVLRRIPAGLIRLDDQRRAVRLWHQNATMLSRSNAVALSGHSIAVRLRCNAISRNLTHREQNRRHEVVAPEPFNVSAILRYGILVIQRENVAALKCFVLFAQQRARLATRCCGVLAS